MASSIPRHPPIDVSAAAAYLGLTERHVRRLVAERRIAYLKVAGSRLRFDMADLDAFLAEGRVERRC